jgi:hypothetical protein
VSYSFSATGKAFPEALATRSVTDATGLPRAILAAFLCFEGRAGMLDASFSVTASASDAELSVVVTRAAGVAGTTVAFDFDSSGRTFEGAFGALTGPYASRPSQAVRTAFGYWDRNSTLGQWFGFVASFSGAEASVVVTRITAPDSAATEAAALLTEATARRDGLDRQRIRAELGPSLMGQLGL